MRNRVLIVEDEPLIAMMLEDFLDALGYAGGGMADCAADALPLIAAGEIDCAIVDVNLRNGEKSWAIADALAGAGIPFVFATGGGDEAIADPYRDRPRLMKPFTIDDVARALGELGG
ncbi:MULTISPECIES: response regulator [Sphingomonas]|uniref:response regulator n=1 Tax=Sphingomonas TaxID=13687 RepID=UPI000929EA9B|nr:MULTISPECIES: response regulator [Sphingomonas]MCW6529785.1 response regulator [Sphingomonas lycopersici]OJU17353.1 MAG: transcriptional regulator [Sphingomonas sp. 66-10]